MATVVTTRALVVAAGVTVVNHILLTVYCVAKYSLSQGVAKPSQVNFAISYILLNLSTKSLGLISC